MRLYYNLNKDELKKEQLSTSHKTHLGEGCDTRSYYSIVAGSVAVRELEVHGCGLFPRDLRLSDTSPSPNANRLPLN